MRVLLSGQPFPVDKKLLPWEHRGQWGCQWVGLPATTPSVAAYKLRFTADRAATVRVHVTADERYELYLDGEKIGRGSERGDANNWYFETYDLELTAGEHII